MNSQPISSDIIKFSGICNIGLGTAMVCPPIQNLLGVEIPLVWSILIGGLLFYTAATLIIGGGDLRRYGSIIAHESMLRFFAAILLCSAAIFSDEFGALIFLTGVGDAVWGIIYLAIVPNATNRTIGELLKGQTGPDVKNTPSVFQGQS